MGPLPAGSALSVSLSCRRGEDFEPRRTSWCGDGLLDCDDGMPQQAAIQRGVCPGCPRARRAPAALLCWRSIARCRWSNCRRWSQVRTDLSLLSPPPVTVLAGWQCSPLNCERRLGRAELRAHLSIGPVHPRARGCAAGDPSRRLLPSAPRLPIATTVGAEAEEARSSSRLRSSSGRILGEVEQWWARRERLRRGDRSSASAASIANSTPPPR